MALKMYPTTIHKIALSLQAANELAVPEARAQITNLLRRRHGLSPSQPNDFQIRAQDEFLEAFNNMSLVATAVLAGIVGISLLVGGIGIMNVLLASVTERTREIGVRKAIGAKRRDILVQFLAESVAISGAGSLIGVLLGLGGAFTIVAAIRAQVAAVRLDASFSWTTVLSAAISALAVGLVFGTYPARRAARLSPIDAIRHE
jgi:putative ABC transport system permease protein